MSNPKFGVIVSPRTVVYTGDDEMKALGVFIAGSLAALRELFEPEDQPVLNVAEAEGDILFCFGSTPERTEKLAMIQGMTLDRFNEIGPQRDQVRNDETLH